VLLLFDIDGTLVTSGGAGRRALARAFREVTGIDGAMEGVRLNGSTDPMIVLEAFEINLGRLPHGMDEVDEIMTRYLVHLEDELEKTRDRYVVLPGAPEILDRASSTNRHALGLATGNIEAGARLKLTPGRLWERFNFGGYGSDAALRADLVKCGIERGQSYAERSMNRRFELSEVAVIGDTERDVEAARACGALAIGVLAGSTDPGPLRDAKPDLLVDTLADDALWRLIGL
jgi:phosphoglycolate phosphatase-like HAD superfamily hydrolase